MEGFLCKRLHLKEFILAKKKIGNEEEWIEMQKNTVECRFFPSYAILVFQIFWQKTF